MAMMVLIAEYDEETLEDIKLAFQICLPDWKIEATNNSQKCLELLGIKHPDIIILDKDLPDSGGFESLKQIRMHSQVPVIFLSGARDEGEIIKALELGADEYITKPIKQLELIAYVKSIIRKIEAFGMHNQIKRSLKE
jgi:DNA-binding response OmpR family regulator